MLSHDGSYRTNENECVVVDIWKSFVVSTISKPASVSVVIQRAISSRGMKKEKEMPPMSEGNVKAAVRLLVSQLTIQAQRLGARDSDCNRDAPAG
jgi:hypothetical protein